MADDRTLQVPEKPDTGSWTDLFDERQNANFAIGVMRAKDGATQAYEEIKEAIGITPTGTAEFKTQEMIRDQEVRRAAAADSQKLYGAGATEFLGEVLPLFAAPLGGSVPMAAALGGITSAGFFQDDVKESRIDDIATGAVLGGGMRKVFDRLQTGGKARGDLEEAIASKPYGPPSPSPVQRAGVTLDDILFRNSNTFRGGPTPRGGPPAPPRRPAPQGQGLFPAQGRAQIVPNDVMALPAPSQRAGQRALTDQTQLALPRPAPKAYSPNASLSNRGFGADDFQNAGKEPIRGVPSAKFIAEAVKRAKVAETATIKTANALVKKVLALEKKLNGKESKALSTLQENSLVAKQNTIAAKVLTKTLESSAAKKKTAEALAAKTKKAEKDFDKADAKATAKGKGLGSKQGGFINTDAHALLSGGVVGGGLTMTQTDNPLAIAAGAIGGAAGLRAFARSRDKVVTNKMREEMRRVSSEGGEYTEKLSRMAKVRETSGEAINDIISGGKKVADSFLGATMTRISAISPRVATALAHSEFQQHQKSGQWLSQGEKLFERVKNAGLSDVQQRTYKIALLNSTGNAHRFLKSIGKDDAAEAIKEFDVMLKDVGKYLGEVDMGVNLRRNYFPRMITDFTEFKGVKEVETYLDQLAKKKGVDLTDFEKENAITQVINGALTRSGDNTVFGRAASQLQRRTTKVTGKNVDAYADPHQGFNDYIEGVTTQVERRRFFKGQNVKVDDLGPNAENIDSVATRLKDQLKGKDMTPEQVDEVAQLIKMRFGKGEQAPHRAIQNFKNLTYTGLLANPMSALTQAGDLALSAYKNGIRNTVGAVIGELGGRGKINGLDKTELLGIRNAAADFASRVGTRDMLNWGLKYSGFQKMDEFGKNTFINAAMKNNQQLDPAAFKNKWKSTFDPDAAPGAPTPRTDELMEKVKNFQKIDDTNREDVGFMLWNELSSTQPIALSALPEKYLQHPDGRMAYMLQSFTLKMFDLMRKDIYNNVATKQYKEAAKNATRLSTMFIAGNSSIDAFKNFILQRDSTAPEILLNNTAKMFGMNKYMFEQAGREGLGSTLLKTAAPPTALFDAIGDAKKTTSLIPVVGRNIAETIE
jgi:hypothetical protein